MTDGDYAAPVRRDLLPDAIVGVRETNATRACRIGGCHVRVVARGFCDRHYRRWRKAGGQARPGANGESWKTPEYITWANLKRRGGVCEAWRSYDAFLRDVGRRPHGCLALQRKDSDKPWGPGNWTWSPSRSHSLSSRMRQSIATRERVVVDGETLYRCGGVCGQFLKAYEFYTHKSSITGIRSLCKTCHSAVVMRTRDPEKCRVSRIRSEARRRARKIGVPADVLRRQFDELSVLWGDSCLKCGSVDHLAWDHIVPLARGGPHRVTNLQRLCRQCNSRKSIDVVDYRSVAQVEWAIGMEAA